MVFRPQSVKKKKKKETKTKILARVLVMQFPNKFGEIDLFVEYYIVYIQIGLEYIYQKMHLHAT